MYPIVRVEKLNSDVTRMMVEAPAVARKIEPGQFIMLRIDEQGERIPLTMNDCDLQAGTITIVFQAVGATTMRLANMRVGDELLDFAGPLGNPTELEGSKRACVIGGGLGTAIAYPQAKWLYEHGCDVDVITGFRNADLVLLEDEIGKHSTRHIVMTDDGSNGNKGLVTQALQQRIDEGADYDLVLAVGPVIMMKYVAETTRPYGIKTLVSMNPIMVDGTGMCGACRVKVGDEYLHACVDGPDFDGHLVDFDDAIRRGVMYLSFETAARDAEAGRQASEGRDCDAGAKASAIKGKDTGPNRLNYELNKQKTMVPMPELDPLERSSTFAEVALGYTEEDAVTEARRCIQCPSSPCMSGCPVSVPIHWFVGQVAERNFAQAYAIVKSANALPAVCGRVCPQETQCESKCTRGRNGQPVGIGRLERFVSDWAYAHADEAAAAIADFAAQREKRADSVKLPTDTGSAATKKIVVVPDVDLSGKRVAVVGSGPSSLTCAGELAKRSCQVVVLEALHKLGGVLTYGIPEFRLPNDLVDREVSKLGDLGVKFELNALVGKLYDIDELLADGGFDAIYVGTGAGLPRHLDIEGEGLNGVVMASELLVRVNPMKGYLFPSYDTPVYAGKRCVVVGGGNVAMDAARTARRLGADVVVVYRRSRDEMPAREEEVHHAEEEGIEFAMLTNPVRVLGNDKGWVSGVECVRMQLGKPDDSGRRSPVAVEGSEFVMSADMLVIAAGSRSNTLITDTSPGMDVTSRGLIAVDERTCATSKPGVFAGGDAVMGAATVILAMGAGKRAAAGIADYLVPSA